MKPLLSDRPVFRKGLGLLQFLAVFCLANLSGYSPSFAQTQVTAASSPTPGLLELAQPLAAQAGFQASYGACPCLRWSFQVRALGGRVVTRDFVISSRALFEYLHREQAYFDRNVAQIFRVGALEVLWRRGHLGVGFNGVTLGRDLDRGYSDWIRTGAYILLSAIYDQAIRLGFRTGYDFEQMRVNLGPEIERHEINQSVVFEWNRGVFNGYLSALIGYNSYQWDLTQPRIQFSGAVEARLLRFWHLESNLGLELSYENDPFRELLGFARENAVGLLYIGLSWVER